jgi:hypothetical protein
MLIGALAGGIYAIWTWLAREVGTRVLVPLLIGVGSFAVGAIISTSKGMKPRKPLGQEQLPAEMEGGSQASIE